ncbi:MAG: growth inhibitor [Betaproteobacteria bacterium RIFCSPLOWO2_12_FULL_68_20]|nr:MAG: growth inhibitor [Betaproteobacteria bacterium RIFCSPLOWO2_12_FULL_68_20]
MPPTTGYSFGDIVLVPFPFTDQSTAKRRPAVVVSSDRYHRERPDLIVMAVTSQAQPAGAIGEMQVKSWRAAGLLKPSSIKPVVTTIEVPLVIRRLGQLSDEDRQALKRAIGTIIG